MADDLADDLAVDLAGAALGTCEAGQDPLDRALAIDIVLAEIICHAVGTSASSVGLSSVLCISHTWRQAALLDERVWRNIQLESASVSWLAVLAKSASAHHVQAIELLPSTSGRPCVLKERVGWFDNLLHSVARTTALTRLMLPLRNGLSAAEASELMLVLPPTLTQLSVRGNHEGITDAWLLELHTRCPQLASLDISECTAVIDVTDALTGLTALTELRMYDCICIRVDDPAVADAFAALPLRLLEAGRGHARFPLIRALSNGAAGRSLTSLSLCRCRLFDECLGAIGALQQLTSLDLSHLNEHSSVSALMIVGMVSQLTELRRLALDVDAVEIDTETVLEAFGAIDHLCESLSYLGLNGAIEARLLPLLLPLRALAMLNLSHTGLPPISMTNLDGASSSRFALEVAMAMVACRHGHPSDEQASLAALSESKWWRSEWLDSPPWRAALAFAQMHMEMAEELAALGMEHGLAARSLPEERVIDRAGQAGDAKLGVLCDAVGCTADDVVRTAERMQLPVRAVRYLLAVALAERAAHVLGHENDPSNRIQQWCSVVLCCALVAEGSDHSGDGDSNDSCNGSCNDSARGGRDAAGPQPCWLKRHESVGGEGAMDKAGESYKCTMQPTSITFDDIHQALDVVEAECMVSVAWSTCGEAMPRQMAARRSHQSFTHGPRGGHDAPHESRSYPMMMTTARSALMMARGWVVRSARRRERADAEEEVVVVEEVGFDLFE